MHLDSSTHQILADCTTSIPAILTGGKSRWREQNQQKENVFGHSTIHSRFDWMGLVCQTWKRSRLGCNKTIHSLQFARKENTKWSMFRFRNRRIDERTWKAIEKGWHRWALGTNRSTGKHSDNWRLQGQMVHHLLRIHALPRHLPRWNGKNDGRRRRIRYEAGVRNVKKNVQVH